MAPKTRPRRPPTTDALEHGEAPLPRSAITVPAVITIVRDVLIFLAGAMSAWMLFVLVAMQGDGVEPLRWVCYGVIGGAAGRFGLGSVLPAAIMGRLGKR